MPNVTYRANMLPYVEYDDGSAGFGAPYFAHEAGMFGSRIGNALLGFAQQAYEDPAGTAKQIFYDPIPRSFNEANRSTGFIPEGGEYAPDNLAGFDAASLAPMAGIVAKALPKQAASQAVEAAPIGFTVGHVSPHDFMKFDENAIGSGIGVNTEGRGFYTTTSDRLLNDYAADMPQAYRYQVQVNEPKEAFLNWDTMSPYMQELLSTPKGVEAARMAGKPGIVARNTGAGFEGTENYTLFPHANHKIIHKWAPDGTQLFSNADEAAAAPLMTRALESERRNALADALEGNVPIRAYHGSDSPIVGEMISPSTSINETTFGPVETTRYGPFFSDNPDFSAEYGSAIYPVDINATNIADLSRDLRLDFADSVDPFQNRDLWVSAKNAPGGWHMFEGDLGKAFTDWLRQQGYDAARFSEDLPSGVEGTTIVPLSRGLVRSATTGETLFSNPSEAAILNALFSDDK